MPTLGEKKYRSQLAWDLFCSSWPDAVDIVSLYLWDVQSSARQGAIKCRRVLWWREKDMSVGKQVFSCAAHRTFHVKLFNEES